MGPVEESAEPVDASRALTPGSLAAGGPRIGQRRRLGPGGVGVIKRTLEGHLPAQDEDTGPEAQSRSVEQSDQAARSLAHTQLFLLG